MEGERRGVEGEGTADGDRKIEKWINRGKREGETCRQTDKINR